MSGILWQDENELSGTNAHEDGYLLMSMALDGILGEEEEARLQTLLSEDETMCEAWGYWRRMDTLFAHAPHAVPSGDFVARFDQRLASRTRRDRARQRLLLGAAATFGWLSVIGMLTLLGWYLSANQTQWMSDFVRELVYYPSAVNIWLRAVRSSYSATVSEPQSIAIACGYAASAGLLLLAWLWLLRRTTHEEVVS